MKPEEVVRQFNAWSPGDEKRVSLSRSHYDHLTSENIRLRERVAELEGLLKRDT